MYIIRLLHSCNLLGKLMFIFPLEYCPLTFTSEVGHGGSVHITRLEIQKLDEYFLSGGSYVITKLSSSIQVFQKKLPPEAVDLVSRFLQYSPNLRCTAVSPPELFLFWFTQTVWHDALWAFTLLTGGQLFSWKPACIPSLTSWGTQTLAYRMGGLCLLSSTSDHKVV